MKPVVVGQGLISDEADAQLIASAPELLEALKRVACCAETAASLLLMHDPEEAELFMADAIFARAAIAKAEGR